MKQLTNYQRVCGYLVKMFKAINEDYFMQELELPTITIQSSARSYGHVSTQKIWHSFDRASHELNLSADFLDRPIEDIAATLIHESVHIYALQNGIKDTSNRGVYHNKAFKRLAEERGLLISRHPKYGWTITSPSEETMNFCIRHDFRDIQLVRHSGTPYRGFAGGKSDNCPPASPPSAPRPSSTRKYICPCCKNSFRATKEIHVLCLDCNVPFIVAG